MKYNLTNLTIKYKYSNYRFPITVFIKITSRCMFKCQFCSQGRAFNEEMPIKKLKKILNILKKNGVLRIFYTGGEPFLYSEFLEIVKYGKKLGFCQLVITNGFLLDTQRARQILKYIDCVSISIHGTEKFHNKIVRNDNSYKKVISGIEMIKKDYSNIVMDICFTGTQENANEENIKDVAELCKKYDLLLTITRAYAIGNEKESSFLYIDPMIKAIDKFRKQGYKIEIGHCLVPCAMDYKNSYLTSPCNAGIDFCAIDINGNVKICANSNQVIGNILHNNFKSIWKKNNKILNKHLKKLSIKCKNCNYFIKCVGGCKCETGNMVNGNSDLLYNKVIEERWKKICNHYIKSQIASIKRIGFNKYLLIGKYNCTINIITFKEIRKIDFSKTLIENHQQLGVNKILLLQLLNDAFLKVVTNEKVHTKR